MPELPVPARFDDLLDSTILANLATIGPDGAPQVNPVWFLRDGRSHRIQFGVTGETQKLRNMQRNPHIALSFLSVDNPMHYLELRGTVVEIFPYDDLSFLHRVARKYTGQDATFGKVGEPRFRITFAPTRWTGR
ncbi:MAG: PPOX class F420-dependent oxidoreductase [Thermomicrobiales bacterium]